MPFGDKESLLFDIGDGDQTNHTVLVPRGTHPKIQGASQRARPKSRQMVSTEQCWENLCFSVSQTVPSLYSLSYLWGLSGCWLSMKRAGDFLAAVIEMAAYPALLWRRERGGTKGDALRSQYVYLQATWEGGRI